MREKKYHLYLTADEQSKVIQSLFEKQFDSTRKIYRRSR